VKKEIARESGQEKAERARGERKQKTLVKEYEQKQVSRRRT